MTPADSRQAVGLAAVPFEGPIYSWVLRGTARYPLPLAWGGWPAAMEAGATCVGIARGVEAFVPKARRSPPPPHFRHVANLRRCSRPLAHAPWKWGATCG